MESWPTTKKARIAPGLRRNNKTRQSPSLIYWMDTSALREDLANFFDSRKPSRPAPSSMEAGSGTVDTLPWMVVTPRLLFGATNAMPAGSSLMWYFTPPIRKSWVGNRAITVL